MALRELLQFELKTYPLDLRSGDVHLGRVELDLEAVFFRYREALWRWEHDSENRLRLLGGFVVGSATTKTYADVIDILARYLAVLFMCRLFLGERSGRLDAIDATVAADVKNLARSVRICAICGSGFKRRAQDVTCGREDCQDAYEKHRELGRRESRRKSGEANERRRQRERRVFREFIAAVKPAIESRPLPSQVGATTAEDLWRMLAGNPASASLLDNWQDSFTHRRAKVTRGKQPHPSEAIHQAVTYFRRRRPAGRKKTVN